MQSHLSRFVNHTLFKLGLFLCLGMVVYLARVAQIRRLNAQLSQTYGHFTAQQMLDRSMALTPSIVPEVAGLQMFAHLELLPNLKGVGELRWIVEFTDQAGNQIANIHWNANSGRVCRVVRDRHYLPNYRGRTFSKEYAAQIARRYLSLADSPESTLSWQLADRPYYEPSLKRWTFRFRAEAQRAYVQVDETVEDMTVIQFW